MTCQALTSSTILYYNRHMSNTRFINDTNWLLIKSSIVAKHRLMKSAEEENLSIMQALTLCLLEPGEAVPMSMISDLLVCDRSNVTGIVERLSIGALIDRRESDADRRVKTIQLTENGIKLRSKLLPKVSDEDSPNLQNLTPEEIKALKKILTKTLSKNSQS
jgi:DNA-binding MarR family transcriptional regulator